MRRVFLQPWGPKFVKGEKKKYFILGLKSNRKVALTAADAQRKQFVSLAELDLTPGTMREVWIENIPFPVYIAREIYVNEDKKSAELYLVCSDATCDYQSLISYLCQNKL